MTTYTYADAKRDQIAADAKIEEYRRTVAAPFLAAAAAADAADREREDAMVAAFYADLDNARGLIQQIREARKERSMTTTTNGCPSCEVLMISGVRCHETGCPSAWEEEVRECDGCRELDAEEREA
jgi:hypothetical protein